MLVKLVKGAVLMSELASLSVVTELAFPEGATVLSLKNIVLLQFVFS